MNSKKIVEIIFQMEDDLKLFDKKIGDIRFWELVRYEVYHQISRQLGIFDQPHTKLEINSKFVGDFILNSLKNIFSNNPFLAPKSDILFFGFFRRKKMEDGLWWDIFCDPVISKLSKDYQTFLLEMPRLNTHPIPCKTNNIGYLDLSLFIGTLLGKAHVNSFFFSASEKALLQKIKNYILDHFNIAINLKKWVANTLSQRNGLLPVYSFILRRIRPKIVVVVCSYINKFFIEACKNAAIPVIELQHAVISKYHLGYSFPNSNSDNIVFPDYFLTFGDYWNNLVSLPISIDNVISVGYPFFDLERSKFDSEKKKDQIIFVSQGSIGEKMSKFAVELVKRQDFPFNIVYKLHPGEYYRWEKKYPWLKNSGINVIADDSIPLYKLLAQCKCLVGVYTTVIYEGLGLGLQTFLLNLPGSEYMEELIESKNVTLISTIDELVLNVQNPIMTNINANSIFKPNALSNMTNTINEIFRCR